MFHRPRMGMLIAVLAVLIASFALAEAGRRDKCAGLPDIYDHEISNGKILPPSERKKAQLASTQCTFDDAANAVHDKVGESFWCCLFKRVFGVDDDKMKQPKCAAPSKKGAKDKGKGSGFEYSKCDRNSGYEVIRDKVCEQLDKVKYTGPKGYDHCKEIRVRKEVRDLSKAELSALMEAVSTLTSTKGPSGKNVYQEFVDMTKRGRRLGMVNGTGAALPWYRRCLYELENELRKINPTVTIPYWDWSLDSQSPEKSVVFSVEFFGSAAPDGSCVYGDLLKGIECVKRVWKNDIVPSFPSPDVLRVLLASARNFEDLSMRLETLQGMVQVAIGGVNQDSRPAGDLSGDNAANDPLFWLIVAFTDKLWASALQRNRCVGMAEDLPLWHFNQGSKSLEHINRLCYLYMPSSVYRSTLTMMGFKLPPDCYDGPKRPGKKVACVCGNERPQEPAEEPVIADICQAIPPAAIPGALPSDGVTITETETLTERPTSCAAEIMIPGVSGQCDLRVKDCLAEQQHFNRTAACGCKDHYDKLLNCRKSSFRLPRTVEELEMLYDEISRRFKIRKLIISAYNRRPTVLLRLPKPLPCYFVSMNRLDNKAVHDVEAELIKTVIVLNAAISAGRYIPYGVSINAIHHANHPDKASLVGSNDLCFESSAVSLYKFYGLPLVFVFCATLVTIFVF